MLTALAASGHVAYDSLCLVSLVFPYSNLPCHTAVASTNRESMTVPLLEGPKYISSPGFELGLGGPGPEPDRT